MDYIFYVLILVNIFVILASSLNLLVGFVGLMSLAQAAFMGIGAYTTAILMVSSGFNFFVTLPIGILLAGTVAGIIAVPSLRARGDQYIIASFAFQIILFNIFLNWMAVTRGPYGIANIPKPAILGFVFSSYQSYFILSVIIMLICILFCQWVSHTPYGLILRGIREEVNAVAAAGNNITYYKVSIFILGCAMAAVAGSLYACAITFIDPFSFTLDESIFILALVIIGGTGNFFGSFVGALVLVTLPEILKFLHVSETTTAPLRQMIYGIVLVLFMRFRPQGLIPRK